MSPSSFSWWTVVVRRVEHGRGLPASCSADEVEPVKPRRRPGRSSYRRPADVATSAPQPASASSMPTVSKPGAWSRALRHAEGRRWRNRTLSRCEAPPQTSNLISVRPAGLAETLSQGEQDVRSWTVRQSRGCLPSRAHQRGLRQESPPSPPRSRSRSRHQPGASPAGGRVSLPAAWALRALGTGSRDHEGGRAGFEAFAVGGSRNDGGHATRDVSARPVRRAG
jgi:hypothetical protein